MMRSNRMLSSILAFAASAFGGARPAPDDLELKLPRQKPGTLSINGRPKQRRCRNEARRIGRWVERQRRRRARRMLRR